MSSLTENLGLVKHAAGYEGWADDMNANLDKVDTEFNRIMYSSNPIINGDMSNWQRGPISNGSGYMADRWAVNNPYGATIARRDFAPGQTYVPGEPKHYLNINITTGGDHYIVQPIEDVRTFAGETVSIDFWTYVDSETAFENVSFGQNFANGESPIQWISIALDNGYNLNPGWNHITGYVALPSIAGKSIGTSSNLRFRLDLSHAYTGNWGLTQVSINRGSTSYPFKPRPPALEEMLCQRYYEKSWDADTAAPTTNHGEVLGQASHNIAASTAGNLIAPVHAQFKVTKRTIPTVTLFSSNNWTQGAILVSGTFNRGGATAAYASRSCPLDYIHLDASSSIAISDRTQIQYHWVADAELY